MKFSNLLLLIDDATLKLPSHFSVKNSFDQVNFYIDIEGHIEDPTLQKALEELGFHTQKLDILGVYEAHQFRLKK